MTRALAGVFVGGAGARMGGIAKGLLPTAGGTTVVERWTALLNRLDVHVVLVGERNEYVGLRIEVVADRPRGIGPLGGLIGLLHRAGTLPSLALACDMPFVSATIIERLLTASPRAPIVAPHRDGHWEPLCARYDPVRVLPAAETLVDTGDHSMQRLLTHVGAVRLPLSSHEASELMDWDTPEDLKGRPRHET